MKEPIVSMDVQKHGIVVGCDHQLTGLGSFILATEVIEDWMRWARKHEPETALRWDNLGRVLRVKFVFALSNAIAKFTCRERDCWVKVLTAHGVLAMRELAGEQ